MLRPHSRENLSTAHGLGLLAMAVWGLGCVDDLRPSTFTRGWPSSGVATSNSAPTGPDLASSSDQGASPPHAAQDRVYLDWRIGHDPSAPCPEEMAFVGGQFCVDRWEASLVEITEGGETRYPANQRVEEHLVRSVSAPGVIPQAYVSGAEAQRACQMAGKRLCSEQEWWTACAGAKRTIYPYGSMHRPHACNEERELHPVVELYGEDAGPEIWWVEPMNNPAINEQPGTVAPTGSHVHCVSQGRIYDMVGNLHEWTNDIAGTFAGGAYSTQNALGCQYQTTAHSFSYHDYSTGFRCCSDPYPPDEPAVHR